MSGMDLLLVGLVVFSHKTRQEQSWIYRFVRFGDWDAVGKAK